MMTLIALVGAVATTAPEETKINGMRASVHRYFDCISDNADRLATHSGSVQAVADRVLHKCRKLRATALEHATVPLAFPSIEEFDAVHEGLAFQFVSDARGIRK